MQHKITLFVLLTLFFINQAFAQVNSNSERVMILPFENISGKPEFNWVGESFAASLADLLKVPTISIVSNDERKIIQQRLKVPLTNIPSLATSLKLAREAKSTLLIAGRYNIVPAQGEVAASLSVTSKIIRVNEGRFLNEELPDGRRLTRDINLIDALANLQTIEGQLAYQILYQRNKNLEFSQKHFVDLSNKVPAKAFEAYIKGLLTVESDFKTREGFLKNALRLFSEAKTAEGVEESARIYTEAALELGHLYLAQKQMQNAVDYFSRIPVSSLQYAEAAFYTGIIYWQQNNFEQALAVLTPLADELKLNSVYNTLGAIAIEAARAEKKDKAKSAGRLAQGLDFLKKASESAPDDPDLRFNYGVGLFLSDNYTESINQLKPVLANNSRDGEAYYLLAKALEKKNDSSGAAEFDNQARRFLANYAKLETDWQRDKLISDISLRVIQPPRKDFVSIVMTSRQNAPVAQNPVDEISTLLEEARNFYKAGRDEDSMQLLRRIISSEPINGQAFLLVGKIHLRRGDLDQAISSLKTALFWDNSLIDAHIALGKIFIEKKDCQQAQNYSATALQLDENNQEAIALQRQIERCSK